ncbi:MAG: helix-turn-helix domain containing protein [Proteobacteria bacterium]|nr:helix-turn-helix domain containing protein [Pseudomonadota bacterium]
MALRTETRARKQAPQRSPGRPREFDSDVVLDAALELFWKQGYRTTATRKLETALGISQSSIYNTFGSKANLLEAALDRYEALTDKELLQPLERSEAGLAAIETFFVNLGHWVTHEGRRGCMLINMMAEDGGETDAITQRARIYRMRVREALCKSVDRARNEGETRDIDPGGCADLLLGLVLGLNIAARGGASDVELAKLLDAVRAQIRGWRAEPS